jgi:hypothetical protein
MENTNKTQKLSPKFFFISLGVLVSLITSVTSFLSLVFSTLDKHFPDALNATYSYGYNTYDYSAMRSSLATLIIFFPLFIALSYAWVKLVQKGLGHAEGIVKKWMLYLMVFLASIVVVIDLVTLVQYFVSGEVTTRFILKVVATLAVAALAGLYYFRELASEKMSSVLRMIAALVASVLVLAAIIASFMVMGSPFKQRTLRLDDRRVQDLQSIQSQVINYWQQKEKLPETLAELSNPISSYSVPVDPEFTKGTQYEYKKTAALSFELCATFALPMPQGWREYSYGGGGIAMPMPATLEDGTSSASYPYPGYGVNDSWDHQAGRTCYTRMIDKDIYPPYTKTR